MDWTLAAVEVEALACSRCKCVACEDGPCRLHGLQKKHTTCARLLRLARRFRGRAALAETPARGPETVSR